MKRAIGALISLYPKTWRARYQREFAAMLEDVPPTWKTFFDVLGGAIKMQLKTGSAWKIVLGFALIGLVVAASALFWIPNQYRSTAVIKLVDTNTDQLSSIASNIESRNFLTQLINKEDLYRPERARVSMEDLVEQMRTHDIVISRSASKKQGAPDAFTISFLASDPGQAQRATEYLASAFVAAKAGNLLDPASLPTKPYSPNRPWLLTLGLIGGVILGAVAAIFTGLRVWKLAPALGIAGMLVSVVPWYFVKDIFTSTAIFRYRGPDQAASLHHMKGAIDGLMSKEGLDRIAQAWHEDPQKLRKHLRVQILPNTSAAMVRFEGTDRYHVQRIVTDVCSRLVEESMNESVQSLTQEDYRRMVEAFKDKRTGPQQHGMTLELIDPASLPLNPTYPNRVIPTGLGLFFGLACAVIVGIRRTRQIPQSA